MVEVAFSSSPSVFSDSSWAIGSSASVSPPSDSCGSASFDSPSVGSSLGSGHREDIKGFIFGFNFLNGGCRGGTYFYFLNRRDRGGAYF